MARLRANILLPIIHILSKIIPILSHRINQSSIRLYLAAIPATLRVTRAVINRILQISKATQLATRITPTTPSHIRAALNHIQSIIKHIPPLWVLIPPVWGFIPTAIRWGLQ